MSVKLNLLSHHVYVLTTVQFENFFIQFTCQQAEHRIFCHSVFVQMSIVVPLHAVTLVSK